MSSSKSFNIGSVNFDGIFLDREKFTSLEEYIRGNKCSVVYEDVLLFVSSEDNIDKDRLESFFLKNGQLFSVNQSHITEYQEESYIDINRFKSYVDKISKTEEIPFAVKIKIKNDSRFKNTFLFDADVDDGDFDFISKLGYLNQPLTSFNCLARFYGNDQFNNVAITRLESGKLKVIDFTPDKTIPLTNQELKKHQEKKKLTPPERGFSIVGKNWHRSGAVLFHDKEKNLCILQGQDEGTYFGVELPKFVKTVQEAFDVLVPEEIAGKEYVRQGEWFMVPVKKSEVPKIDDCAACHNQFMYLPLEDSTSNKHTISSCDIRVAKNGLIYADYPIVSHNEHESITAKGWNTFYKNTALRSFSQEGVD